MEKLKKLDYIRKKVCFKIWLIPFIIANFLVMFFAGVLMWNTAPDRSRELKEFIFLLLCGAIYIGMFSAIIFRFHKFKEIILSRRTKLLLVGIFIMWILSLIAGVLKIYGIMK